ncbi:MAG: hypothetical protein M3R17_14685 [Bacteroidota bacterium]|nr:hypothetical protein [Bacteroidota bacterium]
MIFIFVIAVVSCGPHKVCSGLNPEIGKYNTSKKIRKGKRSLHSGPEKEAYRHRVKSMKKKKQRGGKAGGARKGFFGIHIGGGGRRSGGSIGGSGNIQVQQKN